MNERSQSPPRRKYEKPELRSVELKPEESLTVSCKTMGGSACSGGDCELNGCFFNGS